jgi:hypothetical protein
MLRALPTFGTRFYELEEMGGTTALGILAIKNNIEAFRALLFIHTDTIKALRFKDIYGNTPMHYLALRGVDACGVLGYMQELGGDLTARNLAGEDVRQVLHSRKITCKEPSCDIGACFCASRLDISVVRVRTVE